MKDAGQILSEALNERKAANPAYSLRSFARDLGLPPSQLSHVIKGSRGLGPKTAEKIAQRLSLSATEQSVFTASLKAKFAPSKTDRVLAQSQLSELASAPSTRDLQLDLFNTIAQWHHFTLLELIKISANRKKPSEWFAKKLGLSDNEIRISLERLERLELITRKSGGYQVNQDSIVADQGIPTEAVKKFHDQILKKAIQALTFQDQNERYGISAAMPVKVKNLTRAKKLMQDFRTHFAKEISNHEDGEEIYSLSLQFFRLTEKE